MQRAQGNYDNGDLIHLQWPGNNEGPGGSSALERNSTFRCCKAKTYTRKTLVGWKPTPARCSWPHVRPPMAVAPEPRLDSLAAAVIMQASEKPSQDRALLLEDRPPTTMRYFAAWNRMHPGPRFRSANGATPVKPCTAGRRWSARCGWRSRHWSITGGTLRSTSPRAGSPRHPFPAATARSRSSSISSTIS